MPIYAYKCESCGHAKDVLQKIADAPLSDCPQCGAATFKKQVTAAGFQLKGSGWYVTDFRGGNSAASAPATASSESSAPASGAAPAASAAAPSGAAADAPASTSPSVGSASSGSAAAPSASPAKGS